MVPGLPAQGGNNLSAIPESAQKIPINQSSGLLPLGILRKEKLGQVHTFLLSIRHLIVKWLGNKMYVYSTSVANAKEFLKIVELFPAIPAENSCCYSLAPMHSTVSHF